MLADPETKLTFATITTDEPADTPPTENESPVSERASVGVRIDTAGADAVAV